MARTRVGGKRKGPRDPTKEAQPAIRARETLTDVYGTSWSASITHKVSIQTVQGRASGNRGTRQSLLNE
ncbi:hypothetical protein F4604DRAFT_1922804 [Suillus subluteus]|nr:hypothetical protein F4604DRAFT_1922804 [Suillus subluteus]